MGNKLKTKWSPAQKRIKKRLIDEDLRMIDISRFYGVHKSYIAHQFNAEDEAYFYEAIEAITSKRENEESIEEIH